MTESGWKLSIQIMPLQMRGLKSEPNIKYLSIELKISTVSTNVQTILVYGMISKNLWIFSKTFKIIVFHFWRLFFYISEWNKSHYTVVFQNYLKYLGSFFTGINRCVQWGWEQGKRKRREVLNFLNVLEEFVNYQNWNQGVFC